MPFNLIRNLTFSNYETDVFITSDIDWASDEVLEFTLNIFSKHGAKVTFFATHKTPVLDNLGSNFEVGIHPNFNFLLLGDFRYGSKWHEVVDYYKDFFPDAVSLRSHSLVTHSPLLEALPNYGIKYECNIYVPYSESCTLKPFYYRGNQVIRVSHFWEDDLCLPCIPSEFSTQLSSTRGLKVLDFHPIHIFLNTDTMDRYQAAKHYQKDFQKLKEFVNTTGYGVRNVLLEILTNNKP